MPLTSLHRVAAVMLLVTTGSCGDSSTDPAPDPPANGAPSLEITGPADGYEEVAGRGITFRVEASDPEDGDVSSDVVWSSDRDGSLGTGAVLDADLSLGRHVVRARVEDVGGLAAEATVTVDIRELRWEAVTVGGSHTCGLVTLGYAYCWGQNEYDGQVGTPEIEGEVDRPAPVSGDFRFASISAGSAHTCGVLVEGGVVCWGALSSEEGVLGHGAAEGSAVPVTVTGSGTFRHVTAGDWFNCALDEVGRAWCWGWNWSKTLGLESEPERALSPLQVDTDVRFDSLYTRVSHVCGITDEGEAHCWGSAGAGEIGDGEVRDWALTPSQVSGEHVWTSLSTGGAYTSAVDAAGRLHFWGSRVVLKGLSYQSPSDLQPEPDTIPTSDGFERLLNVRCALRVDGRTLCWGGVDPSLEREEHPIPEVSDFGLDFTAFTLGPVHRCGLTVDHRLYCWGDGRQGELGDGQRTISDVPVEVVLPSP